MLLASGAEVLGIASAFVSVGGVNRMLEAIRRSSIRQCRLIAGTDYAITHPEALKIARNHEWQVRLALPGPGVFHPKLFVGGDRFLPDGGIRRVHIVYVGSSNLTLGGLQSNFECGLLSDEPNERGASDAFQTIWKRSEPATESRLEKYAAKFAEINRRRSSEDLKALGVADDEDISRITKRDLLTRRPPTDGAIAADVAEAAWAGLESVTGGYRYQIEFPRAVGEVIRQIIQQQTSPSGDVDVYCEDGAIRSMRYDFYENSMDRINVPWDVPNVEWASKNRRGIVLITKSSRPAAVINLRIYRPGEAAREIVRRSIALRTWGRTSTRLYGWF